MLPNYKPLTIAKNRNLENFLILKKGHRLPKQSNYRSQAIHVFVIQRLIILIRDVLQCEIRLSVVFYQNAFNKFIEIYVKFLNNRLTTT